MLDIRRLVAMTSQHLPSNIQRLASSIEPALVKTLHRIGDISTSIQLPADRRVHLTRQSSGAPLSDARHTNDPADLIRRALEAPLEFPALSAGTVPGDRVAIAVDGRVPCVGPIVRGAVEAFQQAGVDPESIWIVAADAETSRLCREEISGRMATLPHFVVHDPDDDDNLCLVGSTRRHEPLLVNRTIFDADIVLPIGCAMPVGGGAFESLFPNYSSADTIGRHRNPADMSSPDSLASRHREADEAGWLIGVPMIVLVVPGADETAAHVLAGEPQAVARRGELLSRQQWIFNCPQPVSLVIATISGGAQSQNWSNVGRALAAAEPLLNEGGAVAICSNLDKPPGESLGRLIGSTDLEKTERRILRDHGEDSWPAWQLAKALQRGPVFFLSQLDAETVEDLGMAPIADIHELARLAGRNESCVVIEDSQRAVVTVDGNDNDS
jgi:nickel-dependent lactate racemase